MGYTDWRLLGWSKVTHRGALSIQRERERERERETRERTLTGAVNLIKK